MIQRSEDASRNLKSPWLGPTGAWRWPFDATYTEWAIGLLSVPVLFFLLWLVVPVGGIVGLSAVLFGRWAANGMALDHLARLTFSRPAAARRRGQVAIAGVAVLFGLIIVPNPAKWIFPSPFWAAGPLAVVMAFLLVRQARPFIDGNRPVTFWLRTLPEQWRGVTPLRAPLAVEIPSLVSAPEQADQVLLDFMASLLDIDPKEILVIQYQERTPVVEAMLFDSTARDERLGQHVMVWLRERGVDVRVTHVQTKAVPQPDGTLASVLVRATVHANGTPLHDGQVVVLNPVTGTVTCVQRAEFVRTHEALLSVAEHAARHGVLDV